MSLPPIITNSPLYRILGGSQTRSSKAAAGDGPSSLSPSPDQDKVELSAAAQSHLDRISNAQIGGEDEAGKAAAAIRSQLQSDSSLRLSQDPNAL